MFIMMQFHKWKKERIKKHAGHLYENLWWQKSKDQRFMFRGSFFHHKRKGNPKSHFGFPLVVLSAWWRPVGLLLTKPAPKKSYKERRPRTRRWLKPEQKTIMSPICWCLMLNIFFFPIHFAFSSREESKDRRLSSPYHRHSYHLMQTDSQDAGAEQR